MALPAFRTQLTYDPGPEPSLQERGDDIARIAEAARKAERLRIANALHRLGTPEAHMHAGMLERGELTVSLDRRKHAALVYVQPK
jgi:hypothetical protein